MPIVADEKGKDYDEMTAEEVAFHQKIRRVVDDLFADADRLRIILDIEIRTRRPQIGEEIVSQEEDDKLYVTH